MGSLARPLVMVVDDRVDILRHCERCLGDRYAFMHRPGGASALRALQDHPVSVVILDRDFSQAVPSELIGPRSDVRNEGLHVLQRLRAIRPDLPVLMVTGHRDFNTALEALRLGADFLAWDDVQSTPAILAARLQKAFEKIDETSETLVSAFRQMGVVAESKAFRSILASVHRAIPGKAPICLLGPTGTGKDTIAFAMHSLSGNPRRPFVVVNLAALTPTLIASELFGRVHGAFNDARESPGLIRSAHGGTLFLNEIGDLSIESQVKLLTVLDRGEVTPVGGVKPYPVDFRLVTATSRDLCALVDEGEFRRDLFHRIAVHTFEVPPLAERIEDIPPLAHSFLRGTAAFKEDRVIGIAREAIEYLTSLKWPGNVRELRGIVEAASAIAHHTITPVDIHEALINRGLGEQHCARCESVGDGDDVASSDGVRAFDRRGWAMEDEVFADLTLVGVRRSYYFYLKRCENGNIFNMARRAGIAKSTMYDWRKEFDVVVDDDEMEMQGEA